MNQFRLPGHRDLFYGGQWHEPAGGRTATVSPSTGQALGRVARADAGDVDRAVAAARAGFAEWRQVAPLERARVLRETARRLAAHREELAWIDAVDGGSPVRELLKDVDTAVAQLDFFAGLVTEMKGASVPMGPGVVNFSVREPLGVVVRIIPFNHPFMFCAGKPASALAAGNAVIVKPPEQAPLSALRTAALTADLFPAGILSVVTGDSGTGAALASHPGVAKVALIGSVNAGRAVAHETAAAAEAGFVWVNEVARHFLGTGFGGYKQSGIGREECLDELLDFTQQKNIHIRYRPASAAGGPGSVNPVR